MEHPGSLLLHAAVIFDDAFHAGVDTGISWSSPWNEVPSRACRIGPRRLHRLSRCVTLNAREAGPSLDAFALLAWNTGLYPIEWWECTHFPAVCKVLSRKVKGRQLDKERWTQQCWRTAKSDREITCSTPPGGGSGNIEACSRHRHRHASVRRTPGWRSATSAAPITWPSIAGQFKTTLIVP